MKLQGRRWRLWSFLAGCAFLLGIALTQPSNAQDDPKTDPPKKTGKQPKKTVDPVKKPEVRDIVAVGIGGVENIKIINETLEKAWADNKLVPSDRCSDYEFIRRASLDIVGRIAKVHEIERFLKDPPERRRSLLIERLMGLEKGPDQVRYAEEYADNWAGIWTTLLMTRSGTAKLYQEQMRDWLRDKLMERKEKSTGDEVIRPDWSKIVTELLTAEGETNDNGAVCYILAHLGDPIPGDAKAKAANGAFDMVPVTSRSTRLFLGLRTQCVQCHDHPFNDEWGQHHFWGVNAFFRQVEAPKGRLAMMMGKGKKDKGTPQRELRDNPGLNAKGIVPYERRTGVFLFTDPTFLDGKKMKLASGSTRRKELAKFVINSPYFAKVSLNRMWGHFFGKGMTKDQVDDFGEHNPVTFPDLFNQLSEDWAKKYDHDPKVLIRWICNSRAYGLSSVANSKNDKPEDEIFFSRMLLKSMTPEQLFESLMTATDAKVGQSKESRVALREEWLNRLIVNFGDDEGNEGNYNGTVVQALLLMNGDDINKAITDKDNGTVAIALKKWGPVARTNLKGALRGAVNDLFLAALNRPPRAEEVNRILADKMVELPRVKTKDSNAFVTAFYQDLYWAILNSNEFILNH
ncbi:MAG: DUF1549 domain-containing protein [Gemmataceae bacterium]